MNYTTSFQTDLPQTKNRLDRSINRGSEQAKDLFRVQTQSRNSPATSRKSVSAGHAPRSSEWTRAEIVAFGVTLLVVLFGMAVAVHTDRPVVWLLAGPAPLTIAFTVIMFRRATCGRNHSKPTSSGPYTYKRAR